MSIVVLIAGLAFFAAMAWAVRYHFDSRMMPLLFVLVVIVSVGNVAVFVRTLLRAPPGDVVLAVALVPMLAGAALFAAAISASRQARMKLLFARDKPQALLEAGPFRSIRHPFYASYLLYWLGCAIATLHPANIAMLLVIGMALVIGARGEEQRFARSPLAGQYAAYKQRAGLFWPLLWSRSS